MREKVEKAFNAITNLECVMTLNLGELIELMAHLKAWETTEIITQHQIMIEKEMLSKCQPNL